MRTQQISIEQALLLFGIDRIDHTTDLKSIYRQQALKYHPDKGGNEAAFKMLVNAYELLREVQKQRQVISLKSAEERANEFFGATRWVVYRTYNNTSTTSATSW